ncbi:MAG: PA2169 family four-helix-bundle protein [Acidobacteriota bacterium]
MADEISEVRSTLNNLIETLKDSEQGFRDSAEKLKSAALRSQFLSYSSQRARFAGELQGQVASLGGKPETSGSTAGAIHRGWIDLKAAITGNDDHAILQEAERGEDSAVKNYREALATDLPRDIHAVIEDQYRDVLATHNQVKALRDGVATVTSGAPPVY